jgi:hypothetical protein
MAGFPELVACIAEQQIGMSHQLVKRVQLTTRTFYAFHCF